MKVFDCHSDTLIDITKKRMNGEQNIIEQYHINRLQQGEVSAMIWDVWIDPPRVNDATNRMIEILGAACEEFIEMKSYAEIAYTISDIKKIQETGKLAIILGMEGLCSLKNNISFINTLYKLGIRHAMLTWNEENAFATGVGSSNTERGLTTLGKSAINKMEALGILIDVSHANEKTFWDIYKYTQKPFIASHSNAYSLCPTARNLKNDQLKAIAERNGVIGMNSWSEFIDKRTPTAEILANHVDYIVELIGINHVACGFDFCDYLDKEAMSFSNGVKPTLGLESAAKIPNFISILKSRGYTDEDLEKIAFKNIMRVLTSVLPN